MSKLSLTNLLVMEKFDQLRKGCAALESQLSISRSDLPHYRADASSVNEEMSIFSRKSSKVAQDMTENVYTILSRITKDQEKSSESSEDEEECDEIKLHNRIIKIKSNSFKGLKDLKRKQSEKSFFFNSSPNESNVSLITVEDTLNKDKHILMTEESEVDANPLNPGKDNQIFINEENEILKDLLSKYYIDIKGNYNGNFEEYVISNLTVISFLNTILPLKMDSSLSAENSEIVRGFDKSKKILCLDLDETLLHSELDVQTQTFDHQITMRLEESDDCTLNISLRPHVFEFLEYAHKNFNIVLFTAGLQDYADSVLHVLDPYNQYFKLKLYRDSCSEFQNLFIKELSIMQKSGADLKNLIMVDNCIYSFSSNLRNGILISSYYSGVDDDELLNLIEYLEKLREAEDVRDIIEDYFGLEAIKHVLYAKLQKEGLTPILIN